MLVLHTHLPLTQNHLTLEKQVTALESSRLSSKYHQHLAGTALDRGEQIDLEYVDHSPSGAKYVGEESSDIGLTVYTSNFGATIELDQKVYTWTDKVYITIVAPDHNFDSGLVDKIGDTDDDPLIVQTRTQKLTGYTLAETGTDTGIFSGEVILKGFNYDADGDPGHW